MIRRNHQGEDPVTSLVLRYVLRHHKRDLTAAGLVLQHMVQDDLPGDDFSLSQWQLGLDYYRERLAQAGLQGEVLLDLGCGSGNWTAAAAARFRLVIGCELRTARLACGRHILNHLHLPNAHLCRSDVTRLPIATGVVDGALVYNVVPYVEGWRRLLSELARVVRPGGKVLASWHESGMMLFCLAEGLLMRRKWRFLDCLSIARRRLAEPKETAPLTLSEKVVVAEFWRHSFRLLRAPHSFPSRAVLFPRRFCFLPFFGEALFQREP